MGDPKRFRKKYATPMHPWSRVAIEEERILRQEFGLKNKKEMYKINSFLKKYKDITKRLIADRTAQGEKERVQMMAKLQRLGLLPASAKLDGVLGLTVRDVIGRRLQTLIFQKGLAHSMKQARQFITHRHVMIGSREMTSPNYLVSLEEESAIVFKPTSGLASAEHPERVPTELQARVPTPVAETVSQETADKPAAGVVP